VIQCQGDKKLVVLATTQPPAKSATVRLSTGREATSRVLSLNAADQARWGGLYYDVLASGPPTKAILTERDQAQHAIRRVPLAVVETCSAAERNAMINHPARQHS
jgi:hypothetical protein